MTRLFLVSICSCSSLVSILPAADSADAFVRAALKKEGTEDTAERRELLHRALKSEPNHKAARWHSGYVANGKNWRSSTDAAHAIAEDKDVKAYWTRRQAAPNTAPGHVEMANWCRKRRLPRRERAHLWAAMSLDATSLSPSLAKRLGALTARQNPPREPYSVQAREHRRWLSTAHRLAKQLGSNRDRLREDAERELSRVQTPAALPALETVFSRGRVSAQRFVAHLKSMKSHRAGLYLARQAVHSPYISVRRRAVEGLPKRQLEEYAPFLMQSLIAPLRIDTRVAASRNGARLAAVVTQERHSSHRVGTLHSELNLVPVWNENHALALQLANIPTEETPYSELREEAVEQKEREAEALKKRAEEFNEFAAEQNERVFAALRSATGLRLHETPQAWWEWWGDFNQLYRDYEKPTEYYTRTETSSLPVSLSRITYDPPTSCFAAGTRVWTDRGAVAVEEVKIGDLVLSRDPTTGELDYKPVLKTTVRPPAKTHHVSFGDEEFIATGGHVFWIAGKGWTRTRDLKPGDWFHAAADPAQIKSVTPAGYAEAFNLVVADFHTYFVGKAKVLSHDPLFAEPLDQHVPGLPTLP